MSFYLQLVTEKEVNNPSSMDVQRQLDSSGYLSVAPAGNEVSDSNSPESNTQSFLSYLQDHANTGPSVVAGRQTRARNLDAVVTVIIAPTRIIAPDAKC